MVIEIHTNLHCLVVSAFPGNLTTVVPYAAPLPLKKAFVLLGPKLVVVQ